MPKRVDSNQREITEGLRDLGVSVLSIASIGHGCPDIVIGWHGINYLCEIKGSKGKLTDDEQRFHSEWRGQICVIRSVAEALRLLGVE